MNVRHSVSVLKISLLYFVTTTRKAEVHCAGRNAELLVLDLVLCTVTIIV
jgi:hypothetical protein